MKTRLRKRYGRAKVRKTIVIPPGRYIIGGPGGRYEVAYGADVVYRGDSSQKAHAVFDKWSAESKLRRGDDVYLWDHSRDDDPIKQYRPLR